jgi:hypothetical protein
MSLSPGTSLVETSESRPSRSLRRCTAKSKRSGELCGNYAMKGQRTCAFHGGKTPVALEKAKRAIERADLALRGLTPKAVAILEGLLDTGASEAVVLGAAKDILDRGGLKAKDRIEVEASITVTRPW